MKNNIVKMAILIGIIALFAGCPNGSEEDIQTAATPTATPAAGTYTAIQTVELASTTDGAAIHYTLDGTTPTETSTAYSDAISISETTTVKAIAVKNGMNTSVVMTAKYTISDGGSYQQNGGNISMEIPADGAGNIGNLLNTAIEEAEADGTLVPAKKDSTTLDSENTYNLTISGSGINITNGEGMKSLYAAIDGAGYYVKLDLSGAGGDTFAFTDTEKGKAKIRSVTLGSNVTAIDDSSNNNSPKNSFNGFTKMESITALGVTTVGRYAFKGCTSLATVDIPEAQTISENAFAECISLEEISFPVAQTIGKGAFSNCTSLETVDIPEAQTISDNAFANCTSLEEISLPKAQTIGGTAFQSCKKLREVSLPAVTSIGKSAFEACTSLVTVNLGSSSNLNAPTLGSSMLSNISAKTVTVKLPSGRANSYPENGIYAQTESDQNEKTLINFDKNWANGFRGGGWKNSDFPASRIDQMNQNITLIITNQ